MKSCPPPKYISKPPKNFQMKKNTFEQTSTKDLHLSFNNLKYGSGDNTRKNSTPDRPPKATLCKKKTSKKPTWAANGPTGTSTNLQLDQPSD